MKTKTLLIISIFVFLIAITENVSAQERLQSIEQGISLLGSSKSSIQNYLSNKGFRFNNQNKSGDMIDYSQQADYGTCHFGVGIKNQKTNAISWTESELYGQDCLSEVRDLNFQIKYDEVYSVKVYTGYNYARNLMVSLIFRPDESSFTITMGYINPPKAERKNTEDSNIGEDADNTESGSLYIVKAAKSYFYNINNKIPTIRKAYLVKGEYLLGLKEANGYVYCIFQSSTTGKISRGWILKTDIDLSKVNLPKSPSDVVAESYNQAYNKNIRSREIKNSETRYQGIIAEINESEEAGVVELLIYYKDPSLYKGPANNGFFSMRVTTENYVPQNYGMSISKAEYANFKKIVVAGRRVEFSCEVIGSQQEKHLALTYIKALPSSSIKANNPIFVEDIVALYLSTK